MTDKPAQFWMFYALKRTGHHAIMFWVAAQLPKPPLFLNNLLRFSNLARSHKGQRSAIKAAGPAVAAFIRGAPSGFDNFRKLVRGGANVLMNFESVALPEISKKVWQQHFAEMTMGRGHAEQILVIRDPFSLFGSCARAPDKILSYTAVDNDKVRRVRPRGGVGVLDVWIEEAEWVLSGKCPLRPVLFNTWFRSKSYRQQLAAELGLQFSDRALNAVSSIGKGSSWDQTSFDGKAQQMRVCRRWEHQLDTPRFIQACRSRKKLISLSRQLFPDDPDVNDAIERIY